MHALNSLSRKCAVDRMPVDQLHSQIQEIGKRQMPAYKNYLGSILAGSAFCLFFGGSALDAVFAVVFSALICFLQYKLAPLAPNKVFFLFASSFITGTAVCLTAKLVPLLNIDMINIGVIMLLIPGIALTNSLRDMISGDIMSGMLRFFDAILVAAAIAAGYILAAQLMGGSLWI